MWNSLVAKGLQFAEQIEDQLNESVGAETEVKKPEPEVEDSFFNDDEIFGDDDGDDKGTDVLGVTKPTNSHSSGTRSSILGTPIRPNIGGLLNVLHSPPPVPPNTPAETPTTSVEKTAITTPTFSKATPTITQPTIPTIQENGWVNDDDDIQIEDEEEAQREQEEIDLQHTAEAISKEDDIVPIEPQVLMTTETEVPPAETSTEKLPETVVEEAVPMDIGTAPETKKNAIQPEEQIISNQETAVTDKITDKAEEEESASDPMKRAVEPPEEDSVVAGEEEGWQEDEINDMYSEEEEETRQQEKEEEKDIDKQNVDKHLDPQQDQELEPPVAMVEEEKKEQVVVSEHPVVQESQKEETVVPPPEQESSPGESHIEVDVVAAVQLSKEYEERIQQLNREHQMAMSAMHTTVEDLNSQLQQRMEQLTSKSEQYAMLEAMHEQEKEALRQKVSEIKEEAKKRIQKAKERVEEMQLKLKDASKSAETAGEQDEIIAALREEGQKLAVKQSQMEHSVRAARSEARETQLELDKQRTEKEEALEKICELEDSQKMLKEELALARSGESRSSKLEIDLSKAREEAERAAASNLTLEQTVKELRSQIKTMTVELEEEKRGAEAESQREAHKLRRQHDDALADLEHKLRTSEREANVREDALRHEVSELRKRWQDAVRRADALSMDVQQSTAPLMRQLESMERQNRARAATWAEMETKLRSDLEEHVIESEKMVKERSELRASNKRLERQQKEQSEELVSCKKMVEEFESTVARLKSTLKEKEKEERNLKEKWSEVERMSNEGVTKVRSDMMKTAMETEERYESQVESLQKELQEERKKREEVERHVKQLAESAGVITEAPLPALSNSRPDRKQKKLRSTTGQAEILAGALGDFSDSDDDSGDEEEEDEALGISSIAAMEQWSQRLKGAQLELETLRKQLATAEDTKASLLAELGETRQAKEKLPLFEQKVQELSKENEEKELEILGLKEDIQDVRDMYRSQLNGLLEEKATSMEQHNSPQEDSNIPGENGRQSAFEDEAVAEVTAEDN